MKKDVTSRLLVPVNLIRELMNAQHNELINVLNLFKGFELLTEHIPSSPTVLREKMTGPIPLLKYKK